MYYALSETVTRRLIAELRKFWATHPRFQDLPDNIQESYAYTSRPHYAIVVRDSGATQVTLSADNYMGTEQSYAVLTASGNSPGISVEWIREDAVAIQNNSGRFPSQSGLYFIHVTSFDETTGRGEFYLDVLQNIKNEAVSFEAGVGSLANLPHKGSVRLSEQPNNFPLTEGVSYALDESTGDIALLQPVAPNHWVQADYRTVGESTGPYKCATDSVNHTAIPGVVLAFGKRITLDDRMAVLIRDRRETTHLIYGGKWNINYEMEILSADKYAQREITDRTATYLTGVLRSRLASEGLEISEVSIGGSAEEVRDDNGDDYFFLGSLSMSVETDWFLYVPVTHEFRTAFAASSEQMRDMETGNYDTGTGLHAELSLGLRQLRDPFFVAKNKGYAVIR